MAQCRIGINGMGRIGRTILRQIVDREESGLEVVAVNNPGRPNSYIHLLNFDSIHGRFPHPAEYSSDGNQFHLKGKAIKFHGCENPREIPWQDDSVDIVVDATGRFKNQETLGGHLRDGVKKVVLCAPGKGLDGTFVVGINHNTYKPDKHHIISNASCTTNCLAPVAKVLHQKFTIESGFMTTIHAYTSDQSLLDSSHPDLRRARAAALSMVPTTTGAAKAVGLVIPELQGKLDGVAVRVPTPNVSMVDLVVKLGREDISQEDINRALMAASEGELRGIMKTESLPLVSSDYVGMKESSCVDLEMTNIMPGGMAKVVAWYDNEMGFSNRVIDLIRFISSNQSNSSCL